MASSIIDDARKQGRALLTEVEAKQVLSQAGIPVIEAQLANTAEDAVSIANALGYPVALKVVSGQISHKSDVGGVKLALSSHEDVRRAFDDIVASAKQAEPRATIDGVSVQPMAKPGIEVIAGMATDPQFGPVLMFGLGGVLVEVLKDVAFRVVPITPRDAKQMIRDLQGFPLLEGHRGQEPADLAALETLLMKLSQFIEAHPEVEELDLNPVFAYADGAVAVDARIALSTS